MGDAQGADGYSIEIDLQQQLAYLMQGRQMEIVSPISSGRYGHLTPTGSFKVTQKNRNHYSNLYGKIVDAAGNTLVSDADSAMPLRSGTKFVPAPMRYFIRFTGAVGMHAGYLPGYPASHGCVRMPEEEAIAFFNAVEVGTPVTVFGRTPRTRGDPYMRTMDQRRPRFQDPRFDPRYQQRPPPGYWPNW